MQTLPIVYGTIRKVWLMATLCINKQFNQIHSTVTVDPNVNSGKMNEKFNSHLLENGSLDVSTFGTNRSGVKCSSLYLIANSSYERILF